MTHILYIGSNGSGLQGIKAAIEKGYLVSFLTPSNGISFFPYDQLKDLESSLLFNKVCDDSYQSLYSTVLEINKGRKIDNIITCVEYYVKNVAKIAESLSVPFSSYESISIARDKNRTRLILRDAGLNTVASTQVSSRDEVIDFIEKFHFPVVIKPIFGCSSLFVSVLRSIEDLNQYFESIANSMQSIGSGIRNAIGDALMVEQYLEGPMFSVEIAASNDEYKVLTLGERMRSQVNEVIEKGTIIPAQVESHRWEEMTTYAINVAKAIKFKIGCAHIELIYTKRGPVLIEFNSRLAGADIPLLYNMVYNDNIYDHLNSAYQNLTLQQNNPKDHIVGINRLIGSPDTTICNQVFDFSWQETYKDFQLEIELNIKPGEEVQPLTSNHNYIGLFRAILPQGTNLQEFVADIEERISHTIGIKLMG